MWLHKLPWPQNQFINDLQNRQKIILRFTNESNHTLQVPNLYFIAMKLKVANPVLQKLDFPFGHRAIMIAAVLCTVCTCRVIATVLSLSTHHDCHGCLIGDESAVGDENGDRAYQ